MHLGLVVATGYADWATAFALSSSGIWWLGFAMYTFAYVPEPEVLQELEDPTFMGATKEAVREVRSTVKEFFGKFKILGLYLLAYLLFTDGIQSVTSLSGAYGADVLGVSLFENMIVIMLVQFVAWPSALFFIRFARWTTAKTTLTVTLSLWIVVILGKRSPAPLELEEHGDHEFQATWDGSRYLLTNASGVELGSNPSGSDMAAALKSAICYHLRPSMPGLRPMNSQVSLGTSRESRCQSSSGTSNRRGSRSPSPMVRSWDPTRASTIPPTSETVCWMPSRSPSGTGFGLHLDLRSVSNGC